MANHTRKIGATLLTATMLLASVPTLAQADSLNATPDSLGNPKPTEIGLYHQQHAQMLGDALGPEQIYSNGIHAQEFTGGLVTWSPRTGVQALTGGPEVEAFKTAGGAEKLGALESGAWFSDYCGWSVTSFNYSTRWMVVVDPQTQAASSLDLNSAEAQQWMRDRTSTASCFPDNAPGDEAETPTGPKTEFTVDEALQLERDAMWGSSDGYQAWPTGHLSPLGDRFLVETGIGQQSFVYDLQTGKSAWMDNRVYNEFVKDTDRFGEIAYSLGIGGGRGGLMHNYVGTFFTDQYGGEAEAYGLLSASVRYYPSNGGEIVIDNEPVTEPTDPATVDWSQAEYLKYPGALYYQDGESALIIAANPDGTPVEGATAYRSDWIGYQMTRVAFYSSNSAYSWAYGSIMGGGPTEETALGLPVADSQLVEEDGVEYYVQDFQGGTIKIEKQNRLAERDETFGEITYNDWGRAWLGNQ
ncbi:hypothetical protein [Rothia aerolata]|uniref:Uncharacterized protein n=1 Tax=Rothia aerolata TaxID=1812262 RepID=A0A917ISW0_9MICC|nr:hypothetical protein [Rothia aerolata]GGH62826.1 hypothetical protein GCM10007359_13450 [Rothia aerolata]